MKLGIRLHDLGKGNEEEILSSAKRKGFDYIQLVPKKAFIDEEGKPISFSKEEAIKIKALLDKYSLQVALLGAYFNPVHSNKELVKKNVEYFKENLRYCHLVSTQYVGTETGSYNDDKWTYNPKNREESGYLETIGVFKDLLKTAEETNSVILMEPAYGHVIYSVDCLNRAKKDLNSPNLKFTIDIYNLLYIGNYKDYKQIFIHALETFKEEIKIIHLKDFNVIEDKLVQCGLGKGIIDFSFIIENVKKYCPNATLIFEGVCQEDIDSSYKLITQLM